MTSGLRAASRTVAVAYGNTLRATPWSAPSLPDPRCLVHAHDRRLIAEVRGSTSRGQVLPTSKSVNARRRGGGPEDIVSPGVTVAGGTVVVQIDGPIPKCDVLCDGVP